MKTIVCRPFFAAVFCLIVSVATMAQTANVYGFSGITYDSLNGSVKGTSYTELDYNTEVYYTPYVCGSLYANGVEQVRVCGGGIHRATVFTSFPGTPATVYLLSDHYVDITYQDDPYTSYIDYYGYSFLLPGNHPISYFFNAPGTYTTIYQDSVRLGSTDVSVQKPTLTIENNYTFDKNPIPKIEGDTDLTANISATNSAVFTGAKADLNLVVVSTGFNYQILPASQTQTVTLVPGATGSAKFNIKTTDSNMKSGDFIFRLIITAVRDKDNNNIPTENITVNPSSGLLTDDSMRKLVVSP